MFTPIKDVKVYQQVIAQIKAMIKSGELKRGDKLPSERELVEQLQVSRTSIREALSALQIIGLVESRHGEGNFIREQVDRNLLEPLSIIFLLEQTPPQEILEFRMILETNSAFLAAKNANQEQIEAIGAAVENLERFQLEEEQNVRLDKELHYTIARATGNRLLYSIINSISDLIDESIKYTRSRILMEPANQQTLISQHRGIYEAIAAGNAEEASRRMQSHLEYVNDCLARLERSETTPES
ncbi:MAG: FadR family transcriptional regulator [Firmicutes bacterium]|nr:FadR family transcriptional regulator [Bacillota bacterium]